MLFNFIAQTARFSLPVLAIAMLTACTKEVECNDRDTKELAVNLIQSYLEKAQWYNEARERNIITGDAKIEDIKTLSVSDDKKNAVCEANYTFTFRKKDRSIDFNYGLTYLEDSGDIEVEVDANRIKANILGLFISGQ